jgi:hypothetical protein
MITEQQYSVVKQPYRNLYCRVYLLNYEFRIVDEISGVVVSDSWTISATADIRRTGTITIVPDDTDAYKIQAGSKIFLDKYVQVYIGIQDNRTNEIVYNNMGIYLINNPQQVFSSTEKQITLSLVDLMAKLTGLRNGNLEGYEYQLKEGQSVRDIFIAVLAKGGFTNYAIDIDADDYQTIQFDMSVDGTSTLYDILSTINNNQYINYQMYFDVDGCFHFNKIPSGVNENIMVDDDIWTNTYISHSVNTSYEDLKNDIIVLGKTHESSTYSSDCNLNGTTFTMSCAGVKREKNHIKQAFTTPSAMSSTTSGTQYYLNLNSYGAYPIKTATNGLNFIIRPDTYYVVKLQNFPRTSVSLTGSAGTTTYTLAQEINTDELMVNDVVGCYISKDAVSLSGAVSQGVRITSYNAITRTITTSASLNPSQAMSGTLVYVYSNDTTKTYWQFMGELQPRAEIKEENPDSPFYVNGSVGDIKITLTGGDYDNISTNELAVARAKWELYTRCRLLDSVSVSCLPIYWLDVNWLVEITFPNETEPKKFITKEISISSGVTATQTIQMQTFYSFYEND